MASSLTVGDIKTDAVDTVIQHLQINHLYLLSRTLGPVPEFAAKQVEMSFQIVAKQYHTTVEQVKRLFSVVQTYSLSTHQFLSILHTGHALYPRLSLINHHCNPNCVLILNTPERGSIVALRPIQKGEELTISYRGMLVVDSYRYNSRASLADLLMGSKCWCKHSRCIHQGIFPFFSIRGWWRRRARRQWAMGEGHERDYVTFTASVNSLIDR